ncbi:MAG: NUDIX hydrolase [Pseudomonadota bacterium]
MIARYGEPFDRSQHYVLRPGAYAILWDGHALLTTFQQAPTPEFQLPGGGIDPGEHPLQALHREVWEETGWTIANPRRLGAFRRFAYMPEYDMWAEKLCTIYFARPVLQKSSPVEPDHTAVWMDPGVAVRKLGNRGDQVFLSKWMKMARL